MLWRLANGPKYKAQSYNKYRANGFEFSTWEYDKRRVTQNSGVFMKAITRFRASGKDINYKESEATYYGIIHGIFELDYTSFKTVVFYCDWVRVEDKINGCKVDPNSKLVMVNLSKLKSKERIDDELFILASEAAQVFYAEDFLNDGWSIILHTPKRLTTIVDKLEVPIVYQSILEDNVNLNDLLTVD